MKKRLDVLLCEKDPALSRTLAQSVIMCGEVYVNGQKETKCGSMFPEDAQIEVRSKSLKYVSRGGLKLEKAIKEFEIDLKGRICLDIGASTGGFTDCMLQAGAVKVYAIDVGKGQLHYKLREDPRVVVMEKTNVRYLEPEAPLNEASFASVDVSFISLTLALPPVFKLLGASGEAVVLIKPQFEAGRELVGKKGVVKDPGVHGAVIEKITRFSRDNGQRVTGLSYSPVKGPEGNIEYLMHLGGEGLPDTVTDDNIKDVVRAAHEALDK